MKTLNGLSLVALLCSPLAVNALEALQDDSLGDVTGQEGVTLAIALTANWENIYFDTDGNRFNLGNIDIDTDSRNGGLSNEPFYVEMDAVNSGLRKGLELDIWNVNALNFTVRDVSLSYDPLVSTDPAAVYGTLGIENLSFNGGHANVAVLGIPGVGEQGVFTEVTLPQGTTLDFTINDFEDAAGNATDAAGARAPGGKGGELRATLELNDFYVGQTFDLVENPDGSTGMLMIVNGMHASMDIRNISAGDGSVRQGSYGRVMIDNMNMTRGYVQVNAVD
jgi:hypothetical protein